MITYNLIMLENNIKEVLIIPMEWIWAKRSTRWGRFNDTAEKYHNSMNQLRLLVGSNKDRIIEALINWKYQINFFYKMPESWSLKKKKKYALTFKSTKPDIDNSFKFFTDTLFYKTKYNDSAIFRCNCLKWYADVWEKSFIEFIFLKELK